MLQAYKLVSLVDTLAPREMQVPEPLSWVWLVTVWT
jgi:hypothetical protein